MILGCRDSSDSDLSERFTEIQTSATELLGETVKAVKQQSLTFETSASSLIDTLPVQPTTTNEWDTSDDETLAKISGSSGRSDKRLSTSATDRTVNRKSLSFEISTISSIDVVQPAQRHSVGPTSANEWDTSDDETLARLLPIVLQPAASSSDSEFSDDETLASQKRTPKGETAAIGRNTMRSLTSASGGFHHKGIINKFNDARRKGIYGDEGFSM